MHPDTPKTTTHPFLVALLKITWQQINMVQGLTSSMRPLPYMSWAVSIFLVEIVPFTSVVVIYCTAYSILSMSNTLWITEKHWELNWDLAFLQCKPLIKWMNNVLTDVNTNSSGLLWKRLMTVCVGYNTRGILWECLNQQLYCERSSARNMCDWSHLFCFRGPRQK